MTNLKFKHKIAIIFTINIDFSMQFNTKVELINILDKTNLEDCSCPFEYHFEN